MQGGLFMNRDYIVKLAQVKYPSGTMVETLQKFRYKEDEYVGTIIWEDMHTYKHEAIHYNDEDESLFLGTDEFKGNLRLCVYDKGKWASTIVNPLEKALEIIYKE